MFLKVVVLQGKEPPCFLQLFRGALVIHKGKRDERSSAGTLRLNLHQPLFCLQPESEKYFCLSVCSRVALVLCPWRAAGRGLPAGGGLWLRSSEVQGLRCPVQQPAGGAVSLDRLQSSHESPGGWQEDSGASD